ncbi:MAG: hypothetical protein RLZZ55_716, partial [Bacteroidota bacterium]
EDGIFKTEHQGKIDQEENAKEFREVVVRATKFSETNEINEVRDPFNQ